MFFNFSVTILILIAVISFSFYKLASLWIFRPKSNSPGRSIPSATYTLPLGIDLMYRAFQHMRNHTLYEWTNEILQVPGRTIELNLMGSRMVLTDHPENVKTIMSTQAKVAMEIFLGQLPGVMDKESEQFTNAVNRLLHINSIRTIFGPIALLCPDWVFEPQAYKDYKTYLERLVSENVVQDKERNTLKDGNELNLMRALILNQVGVKQVRAQLVAVVVAAKDPPSIAMSWMVYELARHPEVVQRLREEIHKVVGFTTPPTAGQLKQMPFLQNVIKETLRLYHPLGMNIRHVKVNTSFPTGGGPSGREPVHLLAGERVAYSVMGLQRNPDIVGPDADQWRPSRWETWTPSTSEFIPFNMGPRICLGRNHGLQQIEYVFVRLLQEFEKVLCTNERAPGIKVEMNTKPAEPIMCQFK
ncbi:uncharacterized protein BHQ10_005206 [Talaromyces amestolkiae]|uniref:Cytochrome P450 n=1 Tax=Talaromyces amestolkiae TaxID=1196081 RepID=A0A364L087_TALAM|nr:uncharacterized protein BHQ10_005206 [Talaromyces amestolkiae]RAO69194.1 hypothetical protein BHQ10_005206 [Talaromyces amestolkiae]